MRFTVLRRLFGWRRQPPILTGSPGFTDEERDRMVAATTRVARLPGTITATVGADAVTVTLRAHIWHNGSVAVITPVKQSAHQAHTVRVTVYPPNSPSPHHSVISIAGPPPVVLHDRWVQWMTA